MMRSDMRGVHKKSMSNVGAVRSQQMDAWKKRDERTGEQANEQTTNEVQTKTRRKYTNERNSERTTCALQEKEQSGAQ